MRKLVRRSRWVPPGMLLALSLAGIAYVGYELLPPGDGRGAAPPVYMEVSPGDRLATVAEHLASAGLIRNGFLFTWFGRLHGVDRHIKAGEYAFRPGTTTLQLLRLLEHGMSSLDQVTIPEGLTAAEIAELLHQRAAVDTAAFLHLVRDAGFAARLQVPASSLEGYLFPETYAILRGSRPEDVIRLMVAHGARVLREEASSTASPPAYTPHEIVTMASIVEAEAQDARERAKIAAVYYNRLKQGMKLQADPTVAYALGRRPQRLFYKDLDVRSPYNTYLNFGLPPGPICNPGQAALHAAMNPDPHTDALFFVARGDGTHLFSKTLTQHDQAIARIRSGTASPVVPGPPGGKAAS